MPTTQRRGRGLHSDGYRDVDRLPKGTPVPTFCVICHGTPDLRDEETMEGFCENHAPVAVYHALVESTHYTFEALGYSEAEARALLVRALDAHAEGAGLDRTWWLGYIAESEEELPVRRLRMGSAYRDGFDLNLSRAV